MPAPEPFRYRFYPLHKNYLFTESERDARSAAVIYSLVVSCKLNNHDPFSYFNDVLRKVSTHPAARIHQLLPSNWQPPKSKTEEDSDIDDKITKVA
jgi:hypothetical protein